MNEERLKQWLQEITVEINSLSEDAFGRKDMTVFRQRKNKILIHFVGAANAIEEFVEKKERAN